MMNRTEPSFVRPGRLASIVVAMFFLLVAAPEMHAQETVTIDANAPTTVSADLKRNQISRNAPEPRSQREPLLAGTR